MKYRLSTLKPNGWIDSADAMIPKFNNYIVVRGWAWGDLKEEIKYSEDHSHDSIEITFIKLQFFCDAYCDDDITAEYPVEGCYVLKTKYSCCSLVKSNLLDKYRWEPLPKKVIAKYFKEPLSFTVNKIDYWIPVPDEEPVRWFHSAE